MRWFSLLLLAGCTATPVQFPYALLIVRDHGAVRMVRVPDRFIQIRCEHELEIRGQGWPWQNIPHTKCSGDIADPEALFAALGLPADSDVELDIKAGT